MNLDNDCVLSKNWLAIISKTKKQKMHDMRRRKHAQHGQSEANEPMGRQIKRSGAHLQTNPEEDLSIPSKPLRITTLTWSRREQMHIQINSDCGSLKELEKFLKTWVFAVLGQT